MTWTEEQIISFTEEHISHFKITEHSQLIETWEDFFKKIGYNPYVDQDIVYRYHETEDKYTVQWRPETVIYGDTKKPYINKVYLGVLEHDERGSGNLRLKGFER